MRVAGLPAMSAVPASSHAPAADFASAVAVRVTAVVVWSTSMTVSGSVKPAGRFFAVRRIGPSKSSDRVAVIVTGTPPFFQTAPDAVSLSVKSGRGGRTVRR